MIPMMAMKPAERETRSQGEQEVQRSRKPEVGVSRRDPLERRQV